jgi:hypothetical protein
MTMDHGQFDSISRAFGAESTRRAAVTTLGRGAIAALLGHLGMSSRSAVHAAQDMTSERKKNRKKDNKGKLKLNSFRCVGVGGRCRGSDGNCCSGICEGKKPQKGKKDKSTCVAHNSGECQAGDDVCIGNDVPCADESVCIRTTGDASFCAKRLIGQCTECSKDVECEALFGAGAACVVCPLQCTETTTACFAPGA